MIAELTDRFESELASLEYPNDLDSLYEPIRYTLSLGGKRFRPVLTLLGAGIFNEDPYVALNQALGLEIFHNFTLVHDDIMDDAPLRRGKASVYSKWDVNTAILSGDVMYAKATECISRCDDHMLPSVLKTFVEASIKVCEGQQLDMDFEQRQDVSIDEYLHMIELKTAYLLAASLKIGAIVGGADESNAQRLFDYGIKTGQAFQLMDDYLDAFGDPAKFGKQVGGDILAAKKTFLYLKTLEKAEPVDKNTLTEIYQKDKRTEQDVSDVKAMFNQYGAGDELKKLTDHLLHEANVLIENAGDSNDSKNELINLTKRFVQREN